LRTRLLFFRGLEVRRGQAHDSRTSAHTSTNLATGFQEACSHRGGAIKVILCIIGLLALAPLQTAAQLPAASLTMFATPPDSPHEFELHTTSKDGSVSFWRCEMSISKKGVVTGTARVATLPGKSSKTATTNTTFSGTVSNPRNFWTDQLIIPGTETAEITTDYLADFVVKTKKPHSHTLKGFIVFRLLGDTTGALKRSSAGLSISVFDKNELVGSVKIGGGFRAIGQVSGRTPPLPSN